MPYLQTGIGVIIQKIDSNHYVVSNSSSPIVGNWYGLYELSIGDHVIIQRLDGSKNAHIIGLIPGDQIEGQPGVLTTTGSSSSSGPTGNGGDSGNTGITTSGSTTFSVSADQKYGYGPIVVVAGSSALWMRFYGQNATSGTVQLQGAIYGNAGGTAGSIGGYPGSLLATTQIVTIVGSQAANWYIGSFVPNVTLDVGQYHLAVIVGGTTFLAGYGTASWSRWGPDNDLFSNGPSDPYGAASTTPLQFAAISLNMTTAARAGVFEFDVGSGLDQGHLQ